MNTEKQDQNNVPTGIVTHQTEQTPPNVSLPPLRPTSVASAQKRQLRAQGHHLKPIVQIGQAGLSDGVIEATKVALEQHELIKVSINGESPTERKSGAQELAKATGAHVVQVIGRVIVLYRQNEKPKAKSAKATPKVSTSKGKDKGLRGKR